MLLMMENLLFLQRMSPAKVAIAVQTNVWPAPDDGATRFAFH